MHDGMKRGYLAQGKIRAEDNLEMISALLMGASSAGFTQEYINSSEHHFKS
jgi:hypothetical protein